MVKRLRVSGDYGRNGLMRPQYFDYISSCFPNLEELIVTYTCDRMHIMDSTTHHLFKALMGRGVNVAARGLYEDASWYHFYLATDLSLLTKAIRSPWPAWAVPHGGLEPFPLASWSQDIYVYIHSSSHGLEHNLPLVEMAMTSKASQLLEETPRRPPRLHLATNHVKISSEMNVESLKKSMRGVTSFNIWRDGDESDEEVTQEEVAAINMVLKMLQQQSGELTRVSMTKVNFIPSKASIPHITLFFFLDGTSGFWLLGQLEAWRGAGGGERVEEEGG